MFVRFPVVPSATHELIAKKSDEKVSDAKYWRWVPPVKPGVIVGGNSAFNNVKMDFLVFGYRLKALISHFS